MTLKLNQGPRGTLPGPEMPIQRLKGFVEGLVVVVTGFKSGSLG